MLRLFLKPAIFMMVVLSLFPQVSAEFEEEQQGVQAAYEKAVKVYNGSVKVYGEAKRDIEVIQSRVTETKEDIDKGVALANEKSAEASKYMEELKTLTDEVKSVVKSTKLEIDESGGATAAKTVSAEPE